MSPVHRHAYNFSVNGARSGQQVWTIHVLSNFMSRGELTKNTFHPCASLAPASYKTRKSSMTRNIEDYELRLARADDRYGAVVRYEENGNVFVLE